MVARRIWGRQLLVAVMVMVMMGLASVVLAHDSDSYHDNYDGTWHLEGTSQLTGPDNGSSHAAVPDYTTTSTSHFVTITNGLSGSSQVTYGYELGVQHDGQTVGSTVTDPSRTLLFGPGTPQTHSASLTRTPSGVTTGSHTATAFADIWIGGVTAAATHEHSWTKQ